MTRIGHTVAYAPRQIVVCGIAIHDETLDAAISRLEKMLVSTNCNTLLFVNANSVNLSFTDHALRHIFNDTTLVYCDGTGVRWAALARGRRFYSDFTATDFIPAFLERTLGRRCYLLGTTPENIPKAASYFRKHFPAWSLVGYEHGYSHGRDLEIVESINAARADVLLVGMGSPLQEEWIARNKSALRCSLAIGVGGLFDYWAGRLRRAPLWMRRMGLEWSFILAQQHHKAARYLVGNPYFIARAIYYLPVDLWTMGF